MRGATVEPSIQVRNTLENGTGCEADIGHQRNAEQLLQNVDKTPASYQKSGANYYHIEGRFVAFPHTKKTWFSVGLSVRMSGCISDICSSVCFGVVGRRPGSDIRLWRTLASPFTASFIH